MTSRVQDSVEEVTADVVGTARKPELEGEPENVTEQPQPHEKTLLGEKVLLTDEQRKWFLKMEATPGEDAVKVEVTPKD